VLRPKSAVGVAHPEDSSSSTGRARNITVFPPACSLLCSRLLSPLPASSSVSLFKHTAADCSNRSLLMTSVWCLCECAESPVISVAAYDAESADAALDPPLWMSEIPDNDLSGSLSVSLSLRVPQASISLLTRTLPLTLEVGTVTSQRCQPTCSPDRV